MFIKMKFKQAALATLVGMSVSVFLRTIGTLFPGILISHYFFRFSVLIHFLAGLLLLHFFICLHNAFSLVGHQKLKRSALSAVFGAAAILPVYLKAILLVFHIPILPLFLQYHYLDAALPLAASAAILFFFIIFFRETPAEKSQRVKTGIGSAGTGYLIFTLLNAVGFFNYLLSGKFVWVFQLNFWIFLVTLCAFVFILYFLLIFYQSGEKVLQAISKM